MKTKHWLQGKTRLMQERRHDVNPRGREKGKRWLDGGREQRRGEER